MELEHAGKSADSGCVNISYLPGPQPSFVFAHLRVPIHFVSPNTSRDATISVPWSADQFSAHGRAGVPPLARGDNDAV
jgi:hypothetical protein